MLNQFSRTELLLGKDGMERLKNARVAVFGIGGEAGVTKLPNLAAMQEEYGKLQAQKEALYADYGNLKKQVKEYDVIKQNIDSILRQGKEPEREKGKERE